MADSRALFGSPMALVPACMPKSKGQKRKKEKAIDVKKSEVIPGHMAQVHTYNCTNAKEK